MVICLGECADLHMAQLMPFWFQLTLFQLNNMLEEDHFE